MKFFEKDSHQHDEGTVHSHKHRGTHTHDKKGKMKEIAEYSSYLQRMTKTSLSKWAKDHKITVDSKKSKDEIIGEIRLGLKKMRSSNKSD